MIPTIDDWTVQVDYKIQLQNIKNMKSVKIEESDLDLARLHGKNIEKLKRDRLKEEKKKLISELNKKFGIKEKVEEAERPEGIPKPPKGKAEQTQKMELWDILNLKGIIKKKDGL